MQLDNIDKQILKALFENGRESLKNLEQVIFKTDQETMSHTGIAKRITKLEDSGILKVQANINASALQYKAFFLLMEMKNYTEVQNVIKAYEECPRVFMLARLNGEYDLILGIIGQNFDILHRYIDHCGPTNKQGILHSTAISVSELRIPKYLPFNPFGKKSKESQCGAVCKDCVAYLDGKCNGCGRF